MTVKTSQPESQQLRQVVVTTAESKLTTLGAYASIATAFFTALAVSIYLLKNGIMRQQLTSADHNRTLESLVVSVSDLCKDPLQYVYEIERGRGERLRDYSEIFQKETKEGAGTISSDLLTAHISAAEKAVNRGLEKEGDLQTAVLRFKIFSDKYDVNSGLGYTDVFLSEIKYFRQNDFNLYKLTPEYLVKIYNIVRN